MDDKIKLKKIFDNLPQDIQDAMLSVNNTNIIKKIGEKHSLLLDKVGTLLEITWYVAMGVINQKDFVSELINKLKITKEESLEIINEINEQIFINIRESLKKIHEKKDDLENSGNDFESENLDRDEILRGIEDPHTTDNLSPNVVNKIGNMPPLNTRGVSEQTETNIVPTNLPTGKPDVRFEPNHKKPLVESVPVNLLAGRLQDIQRSPAKTYEFVEKKEEMPKPKEVMYKKDPYREPFN